MMKPRWMFLLLLCLLSVREVASKEEYNKSFYTDSINHVVYMIDPNANDHSFEYATVYDVKDASGFVKILSKVFVPAEGWFPVREVNLHPVSGDDKLDRITGIYIPETVTHFVSLYDAPNIISIIVSEDNPVFDSRYGCNAVIRTAENSLYQACINTTVPPDVTAIEGPAFSHLETLEQICLPEGLTKIGAAAFAGCKSLKSIRIPAKVTAIEENTFYDCESLVHIELPESLEKLHAAFRNCQQLRSITLPATLKEIGPEPFSGCRNLTKVVSMIRDVRSVKLTSVKAYTFLLERSRMLYPDTLYVPKGTREDYLNAVGWNHFGTILEMDDESPCSTDGQMSEESDKSHASVTDDDDGFVRADEYIDNKSYYCTDTVSHVTYALIPYNNEHSHEYAIVWEVNHASGFVEIRDKVYFPEKGREYPVREVNLLQYPYPDYPLNNDSVTGIYIPATVTQTIRLWSARNLTSIVVSEDNPVFDSRNGCNAVIRTADNSLYVACKNSTIPPDVTSFNGPSFSHLDSLGSVTVPEGVTDLGRRAFEYCWGLKSVKLPSSLTLIGPGTFLCCKDLPSIEIPEGVTAIGARAFQQCSVLENINLPESITEIGHEAFMNCNLLTSIRIPSKVTALHKQTFFGCPSLSNVELSESLEIIDFRALGACRQLRSITLPASIKKVGTGPFLRSTNLTKVTSLIEDVNTVESIYGDRDVYDIFILGSHKDPTTGNYIDDYPDTLYVPKGTREEYLNAIGWNIFKKTLEIGSTDDVEPVSARCPADADEACYNLNGRRAERPGKGLYIVRRKDGRVRKVVK